MKKTFFTLLLLLATSFAIQAANPFAIINGTWLRHPGTDVKLFEVSNGLLKEVASSKINAADKSFCFGFKVAKAGFYVIGYSLETAYNNHTFYIKPGDQVSVEVTKDSYQLVGENTPENREMEKWHNFILPLEHKAIYSMNGHKSTYVDFFPLLDEKLEAMKKMAKSNTGNKAFDQLFEDYKRYDINHNALMLLVTPRTARPQGEDFSDYYRNMRLEDIAAGEHLLEYPYGMNLIQYYAMSARQRVRHYTAEQQANLTSPITAMNVLLPELKSDLVKGEMVLYQTKYLKTYDGLLGYEKTYGNYLTTPDQKQRLKEIIKQFEGEANGPAYNFTFKNREGKEVSLTDFKGKVVFIDIWATWCGPCKAQIPALKKLEEEYHGKDIVFVGISVDADKDYQKWNDFVIEKELKGVQLFAGDQAKKDMMSFYKITGIPRFLLIGRDGKVISADAPRPSSEEIKAALDGALKR